VKEEELKNHERDEVEMTDDQLGEDGVKSAKVPVQAEVLSNRCVKSISGGLPFQRPKIVLTALTPSTN
jgi:hypothetical protein